MAESTKPSICFVSDEIQPLLADRRGARRFGGAELQQFLLGEELARRGYSVAFVTEDHGQGPTARLGSFDVFASCVPGRGLPGVRFLYPRLTGLWRAMARADADIYCTRTSGYAIAPIVQFARRRHRLSVFCGANDRDFDLRKLSLPRPHDRWLYRWGLRRCDAVVVQTEHQQHLLGANFGRSGVVIPNGYPSVGQPTGERTHVLWAAQFRKQKDPRRFVEVARRLPDVPFIMAGGAAWGVLEDPDLFESVADEAARMANLDVRGALSLEEVEREFDRARALVNTSKVEGFPNTFLQAWARGIPVVSFVDPGNLIRDHQLGIVVRDVEEMVRALADLIAGRAQFSGSAIRGFFEARLTVDRLAADYEQLFASLRPTEAVAG